MTKKEKYEILHSLEEQVKAVNSLASIGSLFVGGKNRYYIYTPNVSKNGDLLEGYVHHSGYYTLEEMKVYLNGLLNSLSILKKLKGYSNY